MVRRKCHCPSPTDTIVGALQEWKRSLQPEGTGLPNLWAPGMWGHPSKQTGSPKPDPVPPAQPQALQLPQGLGRHGAVGHPQDSGGWLLTSLAQGPCGVHSSTNSLWFYSNSPKVAQSWEKTRPHYPSLWWGEGSQFQQVWSMVGKMRPRESPVGLDTGFSGPEPPRLLHILGVLSLEARRDPSPTIL